MSKITIGFDAKRLFNNFTGLGNYSRTLVGNLRHYAPDNRYILYSEKIRRTPSTAEFVDGARYRTVTKQGLGRIFWRIFSIRRNIATDGVRIFHGLSHDLPFGRKPEGVKYVVTVHDVCFRTFPEMFAPVERMIYRLKYRNALQKADRIVAISESTKRDIIRYYPETDSDKIEVVYQAIDPIYYTLHDIAAERERVAKYGVTGEYLLYVGSINSRKNLLGVVKAYRRLGQKHRLPLVVIGNGRSYKEKVEEYVRENGMEQYITYLGNVSQTEELRAFYRCARMLVYPSFYEGFGLPVAEALMCTTPVVTSSVSSLPEAGGEYAAYVDPTSETEIARAIEKLLDDSQTAREMGLKGRQFVMRMLDPQSLTLQMTEIYEQLAGKE